MIIIAKQSQPHNFGAFKVEPPDFLFYPEAVGPGESHCSQDIIPLPKIAAFFSDIKRFPLYQPWQQIAKSTLLLAIFPIFELELHKIVIKQIMTIDILEFIVN